MEEAADAHSIEQVVDTVRYPLASPGSQAWTEVVHQVRSDLERSGCSVMPDFIRPARLDKLRQEGVQLAPLAHHDLQLVNSYNSTSSTPSLPDSHPGKVEMLRGNAFVPRDMIPKDLVIHKLYVNRFFQTFLASCVELPSLHMLADPFAGLCLNVIPPGREHPWHFDMNEFAVTLLTQAPDSGGVFEYCPNIRSAQEENLDDVRGVLQGHRGELVQRLTIRPGDLQLFRGRFSLHRVSAVAGGRARHSAIFSYSDRPGIVGGEARTRQLFGRTGPAHRSAEGHTVRMDQLL